MRVSELAKELGLTSKEVIEKLAQIQIVVKTHSSAVTPDQIKRLKDSLNAGTKTEVKKPKAFIVKKAKPEEKPEVFIPFQREAPKVGRNDLCPCGSGKKYKKCCGKNA